MDNVRKQKKTRSEKNTCRKLRHEASTCREHAVLDRFIVNENPIPEKKLTNVLA